MIRFPSPPRRILIIKPSSLGDVAHAIPILKLLDRRFPEAHIAWLVAPHCAGLIDGLPELDEAILFDRRRYGAMWKNPRALIDFSRFVRGLRLREFDLAVDLQGLFRSGLLARQTCAPIRIGFANAREFAPAFYTHRVDVGTMEQHAIDRYLKLAGQLGCDAGPVEWSFPVKPADRVTAADLAGEGGPYAVLLPATNWPTKRWPTEKFAALVEPLRRRFGLRSIVAGGQDAVELARAIPGALNLAGKTSLPQLVALLERAALVIANDSGPMHIAAALGRPLVTLFGPTNPIRTGPYRRMDSVVRANIDCSPCYSRRCGHITCLRKLEIDPVLAAAERQLARASD